MPSLFPCSPVLWGWSWKNTQIEKKKILETKLDGIFPVDQFVLESFSKPFRIDSNKNECGILLFVHEDIPARFTSIEKVPIERFFIELNLCKRKWTVNCSYNPHKNNISSYLEVIRWTMDIHSFNYDKFIFWGGISM